MYQDGSFPFVNMAKLSYQLTFIEFLCYISFLYIVFPSRYLEAGEGPASASSRRCWNAKDGELVNVTLRTSDLLSTYYRFSFQIFSRLACCRIKNLLSPFI